MRIDYRSVEKLEVHRENDPVATLTRTPKGCRFDYLPEYLASDGEAVAFHLPKRAEGLEVEGHLNLPTFFSGLVREGVMGEAVVRLLRTSNDDLFTVLAATGFDAVGDVSVHVPGDQPREPSTLAEARAEVERVMQGKTLESIPSTLAGVQPKMSVGQLVRSSRALTFIAKFGVEHLPNLIENEHFCMKAASACGVTAAKTSIEGNALIVKRFDRDMGRKFHVEDALQLMDRFPASKYSFEWVEVVDYLLSKGFGRVVALGMLKLYAYSYLIGNGDLHTKNVSFFRDSRTRLWSLTPAYDLLSTLPYARYDQRMCLALQNDAMGNFTLGDFAAFGKTFGVSEKSVISSVEVLASRVHRNFVTSEARTIMGEHVIEEIDRRLRLLRQ